MQQLIDWNETTSLIGTALWKVEPTTGTLMTFNDVSWFLLYQLGGHQLAHLWSRGGAGPIINSSFFFNGEFWRPSCENTNRTLGQCYDNSHGTIRAQVFDCPTIFSRCILLHLASWISLRCGFEFRHPVQKDTQRWEGSSEIPRSVHSYHEDAFRMYPGISI